MLNIATKFPTAYLFGEVVVATAKIPFGLIQAIGRGALNVAIQKIDDATLFTISSIQDYCAARQGDEFDVDTPFYKRGLVHLEKDLGVVSKYAPKAFGLITLPYAAWNYSAYLFPVVGSYLITKKMGPNTALVAMTSINAVSYLNGYGIVYPLTNAFLILVPAVSKASSQWIRQKAILIQNSLAISSNETVREILDEVSMPPVGRLITASGFNVDYNTLKDDTQRLLSEKTCLIIHSQANLWTKYFLEFFDEEAARESLPQPVSPHLLIAVNAPRTLGDIGTQIIEGRYTQITPAARFRQGASYLQNCVVNCADETLHEILGEISAPPLMQLFASLEIPIDQGLLQSDLERILQIKSRSKIYPQFAFWTKYFLELINENEAIIPFAPPIPPIASPFGTPATIGNIGTTMIEGRYTQNISLNQIACERLVLPSFALLQNKLNLLSQRQIDNLLNGLLSDPVRLFIARLGVDLNYDLLREDIQRLMQRNAQAQLASTTREMQSAVVELIDDQGAVVVAVPEEPPLMIADVPQTGANVLLRLIEGRYTNGQGLGSILETSSDTSIRSKANLLYAHLYDFFHEAGWGEPYRHFSKDLLGAVQASARQQISHVVRQITNFANPGEDLPGMEEIDDIPAPLPPPPPEIEPVDQNGPRQILGVVGKVLGRRYGPIHAPENIEKIRFWEYTGLLGTAAIWAIGSVAHCYAILSGSTVLIGAAILSHLILKVTSAYKTTIERPTWQAGVMYHVMPNRQQEIVTKLLDNVFIFEYIYNTPVIKDPLWRLTKIMGGNGGGGLSLDTIIKLLNHTPEFFRSLELASLAVSLGTIWAMYTAAAITPLLAVASVVSVHFYFLFKNARKMTDEPRPILQEVAAHVLPPLLVEE